jgi:hypothetical protein
MENQSEKTFTIPQVPYNAIVSIEVSGGFLARCQALLLAISEEMGSEQVKASLEKFKSTADPATDKNEETLYILMALVGEIEQKALDQKKTQDVQITESMLAQMFGPKTN